MPLGGTGRVHPGGGRMSRDTGEDTHNRVVVPDQNAARTSASVSP